jgi:hypothetical protein
MNIIDNIQNDVISKKDIVLSSLYTFFNDKSTLDIILPILFGESVISIRLLEWFVTNYSKKHHISYIIDKDKININIDKSVKNHLEYDKIFNVYDKYKIQLGQFNKNLFDPYTRKKRIIFYSNDKYFITTIGQLNFFKWIISNKIMDYVTMFFDDIENDMKKNDMKNNNVKKNNIKKNIKKNINNYIKL